MCLPFKAMNTKWWDEILMHKHTKTQCEQNTAGNLLVCPEIKGQFTPEMMVNSICTMHILPAITHLKFLLSALSVFWFHFQKPTKHVFFGEVLLQHPSKNYSKSHNYQMNMCRIIMVAGNCFKHAYFVWILFFCCSNSSFLPEGLIKFCSSDRQDEIWLSQRSNRTENVFVTFSASTEIKLFSLEILTNLSVWRVI